MRFDFVFSGAAAFALCTSLASIALAQDPPPPTDGPPAEEKKGPDWGVGGTGDENLNQKKKPDTEEKKDKVAPDDGEAHLLFPTRPVDVMAEVMIGVGKIRNVVDDSNPTSISTVGFIVGAHFNIGDMFNLGARVPFTYGSVTGPQGTIDKFSTWAFGAPAIDAKLTLEISKRMHLPIFASIYLPTAAGDAFPDANDPATPAQYAVQQGISAAHGWEEQAMFAPKRFGISPGIGIAYDNAALHLAASTKFEMMFKTGGNAAPAAVATGAVTVHAFTFNWVTKLGGSYEFLDGKIAPGLRLWLAEQSQPVAIASRDYSGPQFVVEPNLSSTLGLNEAKSMQLRGELGVVVPLGGHLGGQEQASANGIRIRADLLF